MKHDENPHSIYRTPVTWVMSGYIEHRVTHESEILAKEINRPDIARMQEYAISEQLVIRSPEKIGKYVPGSLKVDYDGKRRVPPESMKLV